MGGYRVSPAVHAIEMPLGTRVSRVYVFTGSAGAVLYDTGCAGDIEAYVLPYLREIGIETEAITAVVVSHCDIDHFGGLGDCARAFPAAAIIAHRADAPLMSIEPYLDQRAREFRSHGLDEPDEVIEWSRASSSGGSPTRLIDGDIDLDLGDRSIHVLHVPGHSRGHLAIWDPAQEVVAISDAALGAYVPFADGTPSFPPTYRYPTEYRSSVARIQSLPFTVLETAHYPTTGPDSGRSLLARSIVFAHAAEEAVVDVLGEVAGALNLGEIVRRVGDVIATWPRDGRDPALAQPVMGHLEDLERSGRVVRIGGETMRWARA
jgi:glyoxylase-like metal-dependent hydrolase (beta-lactamase superfamily II)